jgi:hypothetical protein
METVEDMKGFGAFFANNFQVRLPHVRADECDLRCEFVAYDGEESLKGFYGSLPTHPEQARDAEIDLVNQRQVLVTFGVLDLIDSDGVDSPECAVFQPKGDDMFDSVENLFP